MCCLQLFCCQERRKPLVLPLGPKTFNAKPCHDGQLGHCLGHVWLPELRTLHCLHPMLALLLLLLLPLLPLLLLFALAAHLLYIEANGWHCGEHLQVTHTSSSNKGGGGLLLSTNSPRTFSSLAREPLDLTAAAVEGFEVEGLGSQGECTAPGRKPPLPQANTQSSLQALFFNSSSPLSAASPPPPQLTSPMCRRYNIVVLPAG